MIIKASQEPMIDYQGSLIHYGLVILDDGDVFIDCMGLFILVKP